MMLKLNFSTHFCQKENLSKGKTKKGYAYILDFEADQNMVATILER